MKAVPLLLSGLIVISTVLSSCDLPPPWEQIPAEKVVNDANASGNSSFTDSSNNNGNSSNNSGSANNGQGNGSNNGNNGSNGLSGNIVSINENDNKQGNNFTTEKDDDALVIDGTNGKKHVEVAVTDAATDKPVDKPTEVKVTGKDSDKVEKAEYIQPMGMVDIELKDGVTPSINNPLEFTLVVQPEGDFANSIDINLDSIYPPLFRMKTVDTANPPEGITVKEDNSAATDDSGSIDREINIELTEPKTNAKTEIEIPQGLILKDENDQPLRGSLKITAGYFSNQFDSSLSAFPGGFNNVRLEQQDGKAEKGIFVTGGFLVIEIRDSQGRKAAKSEPEKRNYNPVGSTNQGNNQSFNNSNQNYIRVKMDIPRNTINPDTLNPIQEGEETQTWNYNPKTGKWTPGPKVKFTRNDNNLIINFFISGSGVGSYHNIDWFFPYGPNLQLKTCQTLIKFTPKSKRSYPELSVKIRDLLNFNVIDENIDLSNGVSKTFSLNSVRGVNEKILVISPFGEEANGQVPPCGMSEIKIDVKERSALTSPLVKFYLKAKSEFTKNDLLNIAEKFHLSEDKKEIMLRYTHPINPDARFTFTEKALVDLEKLGVKTIRQLKYLLDQKIRLPYFTAYFYDPVNGTRYLADYTKNSVTLYSDKTYKVINTGYLLDNGWHNAGQLPDVRLRIDTKEIDLINEDLDLTVEILKSYIEKNHIRF